MSARWRTLFIVTLVFTVSVLVILIATLSALYLVIGLRTGLFLLIRVLTFFSELIVSILAAVAAGATISLILLVSVWASKMTFPPYNIRARVSVTVAIAACAMLVSGVIVIATTTLQVEYEVTAGILSAAAGAVAFAAAWAVGVMSLIERETQQAGMKMQSLMDAVRHNKHLLLRLMLRLQTEIKQRDLDLALVHAVRAGFTQCAEILLATGSDVNARDSFENTCLILASESGNSDMAEILVKYNANVHARNTADCTALHLASKWGHVGCVTCLLAHGANPNAQDSSRRIPLILAAETAKHVDEIFRLLVDAGTDVSLTGYGNVTALHMAANRGLGAELLLEAGAQIDVENIDGNTPLLIACSQGNEEIAENLLIRGANVNKRNNKYKNCVHLAAISGHSKCLGLVLGWGADAFATDFLGHSTLWYAVNASHANIAKDLIKMNCHIQCSPNSPLFPDSVLKIALDKNNVQILKYFAQVGYGIHYIRQWTENVPIVKWTESDAEAITWLRMYLRQPFSMAQHCRLAVRQELAHRLMPAALTLPLPKRLISYVIMDDL